MVVWNGEGEDRRRGAGWGGVQRGEGGARVVEDSVEALLSKLLAPSSQDDRAKDFSLPRRLVASVIQLRCTLSSRRDYAHYYLDSAPTSRRRYTVRSRRIPEDNPDTRFPITMLRNDTSARHHRSSFMDCRSSSMVPFNAGLPSPAPSVARRVFMHSSRYASRRYLRCIGCLPSWIFIYVARVGRRRYLRTLNSDCSLFEALDEE